MTSIRIGDLRRRLTLQQPVRASDGAGGVTETWEALGNLWAAVRPLRGSEQLEADRVSGRVTHEILIRYRPGVTAQMRFVLSSRVFELRSVIDDGDQQRFLKCFAEERDL